MKGNDKYSFLASLYDLIFLKILGYEKAANFYVTQLLFDKNASIKVLDAGCGTGLYTTTILKKFPNAEVSAFDLNLIMLKQLQIKLKRKWKYRTVKTFVADITHHPLLIPNEKFDL